MSKIIEVNNLSKVYDGRVILDDVNFSINQGEIFVIVGGSGCGKSTLLRQLIGLEKPTNGDITVAGMDFVNARGKEKQKILREIRSFVPVFRSFCINDY